MHALRHDLATALLLGIVSVAACGQAPASEGQRPRSLVPEASGVAGSMPSEPAFTGEQPAPRLCPANNLTQPCTCDDGAAGRQICIETRGWGACDCGQLVSVAQMDEDVRAGPTEPPANRNVGVSFEDYVMPQSADCEPGTYVGTFECDYLAAGAENDPLAIPIPSSGSVSFVLERTGNSEVLEIRDGLLDGLGNGLFFFFGYLTGQLTCIDGAFSGSVFDGFFNPLIKGCAGKAGEMPGVDCVITDRSDPNYVAWDVTLEGDYDGTLDPTTDTIQGHWSLVPTQIGGSCDGTFTVTLQP